MLAGDGAKEKYDLIVSNPPYITDADMKKLQPEVTFEPETALAGGADGLDFYRAIVKNYKNSLLPGGAIAFETGANSAEKVAVILAEAGFLNIDCALDIEERQRVVFGTVSNI